MTLYVRMTDRFMSGWGGAQGAVNVLVVKCDTPEQAHAIERAARERREMRRVAVCLTRPKARRGVVYTRRDFSEMGGSWLAYYSDWEGFFKRQQEV